MLATVARLDAAGPDLLDGDANLKWPLSYDDVDSMADQGKLCSYQERRGRDLYCVAADHRPDREHWGRTSLAACGNTCTLPATRLLCSAFCHVEVVIPAGKKPEPKLSGRICDRGHQIEVQGRGAMRPGDHHWWHRVIDISTPTSGERLPPLAFNDALDFLSWVWRAKFPQLQPSPPRKLNERG